MILSYSHARGEALLVINNTFVFAIVQCAAWDSTSITHKINHPINKREVQNRWKRKKENYARSRIPSCCQHAEYKRTLELQSCKMLGTIINICSKFIVVWLKEWNSERCPRFVSLCSTQGDHFRLLLPPPCSPTSTEPGEGLHGGLRRLVRLMPSQRYTKPAKRRHVYARFWMCYFHPKAVWTKTSIVHTMTDNSKLCAVSNIHWSS